MHRKDLLKGVHVVEFAGVAPGPFCGLVLADLGATVIRVDTLASINTPLYDILCRGKKSIAISAKAPAGRDALLRLISGSDVVIDTYRAGVLEKLGLGPEVFLGNRGMNTRLIYARLEGFDSHSGYKGAAGHDLNFLAHSGVLGMLPPNTPEGRPSFPLNIMGSMGGGGLLCAAGILAALFSLARSPSERGMIIESNIVSGTRYFASLALLLSLVPNDIFHSKPPGRGIVDGAAPFYNIYQCADGKWMSVGCYEPHFYATFCKVINHNLSLDFTPELDAVHPESVKQHDRSQWKGVMIWIQAAFKTRPQLEWERIFKGTDACVVPVLTPSEAAEVHGAEPAPHPHFTKINDERSISSTRSLDLSSLQPSILRPGTHTFEILHMIGMNNTSITELQKQGALGTQLKKVSHAKL